MFMRAVHPGQILKDELEELSITPTVFSRQIEVPPNRVSQIIAGKRSVTGDTALRFGTDPQILAESAGAERPARRSGTCRHGQAFHRSPNSQDWSEVSRVDHAGRAGAPFLNQNSLHFI